MKKLLLFTMILSIGIGCLAQGNASLSKEEKKLIRQREKEQREKVLSTNISQAIESGYFVLKTDRINNHIHVNPSLNFIAVLGKEAYLQTANSSGLGANGVGGITVKGEIKRYTVKRNERTGGYTVQFSSEGPSAYLSIIMRFNATGQMATASIRPVWGRTIGFSGTVVPASASLASK